MTNLVVRYAMKRIEETHLLAGEILAIPSVFNRITEQMCYFDGDRKSRVFYADVLNVMLWTIQESK